MRMVCATIFLLVALVSPVAVAGAAAQSTASGAPTLIPISGALQTPTGEPRTGSVLLVLSLYDGRDDPSPRWVEHQVVTLDAAGQYDVQFGSTLAEGCRRTCSRARLPCGGPVSRSKMNLNSPG